MRNHFITCEDCVCVFNYFLYNYTDSFMRNLVPSRRIWEKGDSLSISVNSVINSKIKILKRENYGTFFILFFVFRGKKDKKQLTEANFECLAYFFGNTFFVHLPWIMLQFKNVHTSFYNRVILYFCRFSSVKATCHTWLSFCNTVFFTILQVPYS